MNLSKHFIIFLKKNKNYISNFLIEKLQIKKNDLVYQIYIIIIKFRQNRQYT
jgi:hypothetical protein